MNSTLATVYRNFSTPYYATTHHGTALPAVNNSHLATYNNSHLATSGNLATVGYDVTTSQPITSTEHLDGLEVVDTLGGLAMSSVDTLPGCEMFEMCAEIRVFDSVLTVWYITQCLATVFFNVYILHKLWKQRKTRHRFIKERINSLILALTLTDLVMVVPMCFTTATFWYGRKQFKDRYFSPQGPPTPGNIQMWCDISSLLFGMSSQLSILIVMLISSLRLTSICLPLKAHIILSSRVVLSFILGSVLLVLGLAVVPYAHTSRAAFSHDLGICGSVSLKNQPLPESVVFLTSSVPFLLPLIVSVLCLVGLCMRMVEYSRAKPHKTQSGKRSSTVTQTLKTSMQITLVFILCYTPFILDGLLFLLNNYKINTFYSGWVCKDCSTIMYLRHFLKVLLIYLNGIINPFLYGTSVIQGQPDLTSELPGFIRRGTMSLWKKISLAKLALPLNGVVEEEGEGEMVGLYSPEGSPANTKLEMS